MSSPPISVRFRFTVERPDGSVEFFNVKDDGVTVGRIKSNDIIVRNDSAISREHCRFDLASSKDQISIRDLGSSNGTFLNGDAVGTLALPLSPGDKVQVGSTIIRLSVHRPSVKNIPPKAPPTPIPETVQPDTQPSEPRFGVPLPSQPGEQERTTFCEDACTCGRCGATISTKDLFSGDKIGCAQCRAIWKIP